MPTPKDVVWSIAGPICFFGVVIVLIVSCTAGTKPSTPRQSRIPPPERALKVSQQVALPGADGTVYLVRMPSGPDESHNCLLHVGPTGTSSIACPGSADYTPDPQIPERSEDVSPR